MAGRRTPAQVRLDAFAADLAAHLAGHAVEDEIARLVWQKVQSALAGEDGELEVTSSGGLLVSGDEESIGLVLALIEFGGVECRHSVQGEGRDLPRIVRNLEVRVRCTGNEAQAAGPVEHG